ncbi:hypothetical protein FB45DRAFT_480155 [Roridomyces roridus]|uniref:F-box domain-containing protein n=1 Tax=Roridomyces roridus TaxID=1738132 RepID=A0AAD7BZS1_9AGAR|nr:hypothetical protein FB45DRAFT_480155 [Roridomyces roridus]
MAVTFPGSLFFGHHPAALLYPLMTITYSPTEKAAKAARAQARVRIPMLAEKMASLRRELELLEHEHQQAVALLANCKFPTETLATEIMSEIFRHVVCTFDSDDDERNAHLVGRWSTRIVLQVCQRWREIGIATGDLWAEMDLGDTRFHIPRFMEHGHALPVLEDWLKFSGTRPLTVTFDLLLDRSDKAVGRALFDALLGHATRWHDMDLGLNGSMVSQLNRSFPLLRRVCFAVVDGPPYILMDRPEDERPQIFFNAPELKTLELQQPSFSTWATFLRFPWAQLTTLIAKAYYREGCAILSQCTGLEECCLTLEEPVELRFWDPPSWEMPRMPPFMHLRKLSLPESPSLAHPESIVALCEGLDLPVLEELEIYEGFIGENPVATLVNLRMDMSVLRRITICESRSSRVYWVPKYEEAFPGVEVKAYY